MGVTFDDTEKKFVFDLRQAVIDDMGLSIRNAVDSLHKKINLYHYDLVVMPESRNKVNDITIFSLIGRKDLMAESL